MANEAERSRSEQTNVKDAPAGLLDQVITETRIGRNEEQREESRRQISAFVEEAMRGTLRISKDIEATIAARIADIDQLLTRQLNEIMHAEDFQKLEGSWRGLNYLVMQSETSTTLKTPGRMWRKKIQSGLAPITRAASTWGWCTSPATTARLMRA